MDEIDSTLKSALLKCCKNVARLKYNGKASVYITYQIITGNECYYSDDENCGTVYMYRIHIFSKQDYVALVEQIKTELKAAGGYSISIDAEVYENDTGYFHIPMSVKFMEVI